MTPGEVGALISNDHPDTLYDFERLERAVRALVERGDRLQAENQGLRAKLSARDRRIRRLDEKLLETNQRRQDALKRIDNLIAQLDLLDERLAGGELDARSE
jgi:chromosome segregation ATPase